MSKVLIYGFIGTFVGEDEHEYVFPKLNDTHKCMLFLCQKSEESDLELAKKECVKFGFDNISVNQGQPLKIEVLNTDKYKGFIGYYEEALEYGSSLVYYPNT
jgi:hypothetical protein